MDKIFSSKRNFPPITISLHFNLIELGRGVFAAISTGHGAAICNAGLIDMGDKTLVYASGHTGSDTFLYLPEDGMIFTGDLLFVQSHPVLAGGDPFKLIVIFETMKAFSLSKLIPGHGQPGTKDDLNLIVVSAQ